MTRRHRRRSAWAVSKVVDSRLALRVSYLGMRRTTGFLLLLAAGTVVGCRETPLGPDTSTIRLEATIGRSTIAVGDTTSFVFGVRNVGARTVRLTFGSGCQVLPYVTAEPADQVVFPGGGGWFCTDVITELVLPPGASHTGAVVLRGGSEATSAEVPLPPGEYRAFATLADPHYALRSEVLMFTVR